MIGEQVSHYKILSAFGHTGHGELFHAERLGDKLAVTIQILPAGVETSFAAVGVTHPALVKVLECGVTKAGQPYLVLPQFEGESLPHRLASAPLTGAQVASATHQVANALDALHTAGFVHRCLTTASVWIIDHHIVVLDAGLVAERGAYSAPEPWEAAAVIDPHADIYALGCLAFELATGHAPFLGTPAEVRDHHAKTPPPLGDLPADFPPTLAKLLERMLDKNPAHRPRLARELARVLALLAGGEKAAPLMTTVAAKAGTPNLGPTLVTSGPTLPTTLDPDAVTLRPRKT